MNNLCWRGGGGGYGPLRMQILAAKTALSDNRFNFSKLKILTFVWSGISKLDTGAHIKRVVPQKSI